MATLIGIVLIYLIGIPVSLVLLSVLARFDPGVSREDVLDMTFFWPITLIACVVMIIGLASKKVVDVLVPEKKK